MFKRKMLRDLKVNISQFLSIFLMAFMGIMIFTGFSAVGGGMAHSSKEFYQDTNLSDAYLYGQNFTEEDIELLKEDSSIHNAELRLQLESSLKNRAESTIQLNYVDANRISSNEIIEGSPYTDNSEGIWLDYSFASANNLNLGDTLDLLINGQPLQETIKGLIMNPEYVYWVKGEDEAIPDYKNRGYGFLSANHWNLSNQVPYNQILLKTDLNKTKLNEIIATIFPEKTVVLVMKEDLPSVAMFNNEINQMKAMETVFPIVFLLIAILTSFTTMTRLTANQRGVIGSLKALGFSNRKILWHYTSYGFLISATGGLLGIILGPILLPTLIYDFQKTMYALPKWQGHMAPWTILVVILCILFCGISGYLACKKELHGTAAQILRPKAPKLGKHTRFEKGRWWNKQSFDVQWNIRDIIRNPMRSVITILGIVGCMALILCALGLKDTVESMISTSYEDLYRYESKVTLSEDINIEQINKLRDNSKNQFIQESAIEVKHNNEISTSNLTVLSSGDLIRHQLKPGRFVDLPKEGLAITNKYASQKDLSVGDTLTYRIYGTKEWISGKITLIMQNPLGQGVYITEAAYQKLNQTMLPTSFVTETSSSKLKGDYFKSIQSKEDLRRTMNDLLETLYTMIVVLILAASILGIVVLYNLGVLSFHERIRELTTLKVLGFHFKQLYRLLQMQTVWLTLFGIFLGLFAGYSLLAYMMQFMGDSMDMPATITPLSYCFSIIGTLILSLLVNWILGRRLKTIDMVSALKSVD